MTNWGDYNIYDWTSYENIPLIKGTHVLKFYIENSGFNCDKMEFVFESFSTDVNENTISQLIVYAQGKNIIVENASEEITITDALGRVIDRDDVHAVCTGIRTFAVPASGVYIVKVGDKSYMILVK